LYSLYSRLAILKRFFNISLSVEEYRNYQNNRSSYSVPAFREFIAKEAPKYGLGPDMPEELSRLDGFRRKMQKFYAFAFKRDMEFLKRVEKAFEKENRVAIVTGGFHTTGLGKLLKEKGYSVTTVLPEMTDDPECRYFDLLGGGTSPEEKEI
ncbi:MAG: hypothetical protein HQL30_12540, partial [Candidatus Omnitrophica bacterium]|nr:hypothetical protein [Candidatus Omnitrophota bacterium]